MDLPGIREAIKRQPFEPFRMCLADGRNLAVKHPEAVAVGRRRLRNRQEITWTFGCPIAPHLWPLLNRQIFTVAHYTSGLAQSARPNLRHT